MNNFEQESILYYPTIEFQSETWVKSALLFWDKIYRIVPEGYKPEDTLEINLAKDAGLIDDIELSVEDLKKTAEEFENFCESIQWIPDGFNSSTFQVRLHSSKIDTRLKPFFTQFSKSIDREGFYRLPEKIANGYMFFLSDTVSRRRNIAKLTDSPDMFAAMSYFDMDGNFDDWITNDEASDFYSTIIIENLLPADIRSINISQIIRLNEQLVHSKKQFRVSVSQFNERLTKIEDKEFAIKEIAKFKSEMSDVNKNRIEILQSTIKELTPSLLYVGVPVGASSIIESLFAGKDDIFSFAASIGKGVILTIIASIASAGKDIREKWTSQRSNYYLELMKHLTSSEKANIKLTDLSGRLDEFIND
ncbi:MAG TPA: hypothetical protein VE978_19695 [Chitinophagales bacterium]|nr:hypothetical protein [Chitinophagales bacterium]